MTASIGIAAAAEQSGLSAHTLRYYERIGLIDEVARDASGHRCYTERDLAWISFLTNLRRTGMPIADMCRYAELVRQGNESVPRRRDILIAHRDRVRADVAVLTAFLDILDYKIDVAYRQGRI